MFLVSWQPDASMAQTTWDDYVELGAITAIEKTLAVCRTDKINVVGWCVGGTIPCLRFGDTEHARQRPGGQRDIPDDHAGFRGSSDLGVFVDEAAVIAREQSIGKGGLFRAKRNSGLVFQTLRQRSDLALCGEQLSHGQSPEAFDLLYWNADATNLPGPMYAWYLRNMYLENKLCKPGLLDVCGLPVNLGQIDVPTYVLATVEDHIVPWQSAYQTTQLVGGRSQFVLGASRHIAGVVNPAGKNKRSYWVDGELGGSASADAKVRARRPVVGGRTGSAGNGSAQEASRRAQGAGQCAVQTDRAGAGTLCESARRLTNPRGPFEWPIIMPQEHQMHTDPLIERTASAYAYPLLIKQLLHALAVAPDQEIVYRDLKRYRYRELHQPHRPIGRRAGGVGIGGGDTVAVMDWDSHRYLESYFAVPMMGAVLMTVNVRLSPEQIRLHAQPLQGQGRAR